MTDSRLLLPEEGVFPKGAIVTIVRMVGDKRRFGVAMRGGKYVVPLPRGYDGLTRVRWINGHIFVWHPQLPGLLADTTTGKTRPCDADTLERVTRDVRRALGLSTDVRIIH